MEFFTFAVIGVVILAIVTIAKTATIVPQQHAYVIENLGKYSRTLRAGFHILVPFTPRPEAKTASLSSPPLPLARS